MRAKRQYDPEFKREAVRLVVEEGLRVREVERNLGITHGVLKGWVQKHHDHQDATFNGQLDPESPEAALKRLRKENEQLRRERDILKKSSGHLLNGPKSIFGFITEHRSEFGVMEVCRVLGTTGSCLIFGDLHPIEYKKGSRLNS